jgi:CDP-diacylglycerol--glycerol-3-phosphate 3-phosphatidyltransferase
VASAQVSYNHDINGFDHLQARDSMRQHVGDYARPINGSHQDLSIFYRYLPLALTVARFLLAPLLFILAIGAAPGSVLLLICVITFFTDLLDGILARQFGVATAALRRLDVLADIVFYLGVLAALWCRRMDVIVGYGWFFCGFILAEAVSQLVSFYRFQQSCATHTYLNKVWAVALCIACSLLFVDYDAAVIVPVILILGVLAYVEVFLILTFAQEAPIDVKTLWHLLGRRPTAPSDSEGS